MAKKNKKRKQPDPMVYLDGAYAMELGFSKRLKKEPETLRRLAHRTVDLLVDAGHLEWLSRSAAVELGHVADDLVVEHMNKLVDEVRAEGKGAARG